MSKNLLLIFTRNPELGKVKTRLAKSIGNDKALKVYIELLNQTKRFTENLPCDKIVWHHGTFPHVYTNCLGCNTFLKYIGYV